MKNVFLMIISVAIMSFTSYAKTPPVAVQAAFEKMFPTATKVKWDKEEKKEWEAEFILDGCKTKAKFDDNGTWVKTKKHIPFSDLPKAVADAIKLSYPDWIITEVEKTESPKHGIIYKAEIKNGKLKKEIKYKENGSVVADK